MGRESTEGERSPGHLLWTASLDTASLEAATGETITLHRTKEQA